MSSSNTFGTFLRTYNTLSNQHISENRENSRYIIDIIRDIAKSDNGKLLKEVSESTGIKGGDLLAAVIEGKSNGLIEIDTSHGESIARLTDLGKAFSG